MPAPAPVAAPAPAEPTAAPPVTAPAPPVTAVPPVAFDNMVLILDIITSVLLIKILVQVWIQDFSSSLDLGHHYECSFYQDFS